MSTDEIKKIADRFREQGKMIFPQSATEDQIKQFEKKHQIQLPSAYKEWLQYSDGGEFFLPAGIQMYGVANKPLINPDDNDRPDDKYIVIGETSWGDPILCEKGGEKISIFNHEDGTIAEDEVYEDFFAFLGDLYDLLGIGE